MTDVPGRRPASSGSAAGAGDVVRPGGGPGQDGALQEPDVRAGLRLLLAVAGAVALAVGLGPVALLVHDRWSPLVRLDASVSRAAERAEEASPLLRHAALALTHLGDPLVVTLGSLVTVVALLVVHRRRAALFVAVARIGALVLSQTTKQVVGRARPVFAHPIAHAGGASFPSGHALGGSVFWLTTALVVLPAVAPSRRRLVLAAAVVVSLVVAATRVLIGVHFLTDVVAGLLVGGAWTAVCASVFALWRHEEGRPQPVLQQGVDA
ncbi:MAG: hypothetical protein JWN17_496 [Frankiales bacterium]|nr:hypothetical protein [Frankiales bacterium]